MAARKKETAEQKLLKMIEASQSDGGEAVSKKKKKTSAKKNASSLVKFLNFILIAAILLVACLLAYEFKAGTELINAPVDLDAGDVVSRRSSTGGSSIDVEQRLPYYLGGIQKRNFFMPFEEEVKQAVKIDTVSDFSKEMKNYRLVGISWMDRAETASVMIEDKAKQVTHVLQKGEKVDSIRIKTIYADSVEIGYQNEEMILRYDKPQL